MVLLEVGSVVLLEVGFVLLRLKGTMNLTSTLYMFLLRLNRVLVPVMAMVLTLVWKREAVSLSLVW